MVLSDMKPTSTSSDRDGVGISISKRDLTPADYLLTIQSYSFSMDTKVEKLESNVFQAGRYTWKLILYPRGNSKSNGEGYVSLYLKIADTEKFSDRWEVNVSFKLFVFDHKNNNYLTIQDADGTVRKFNEMKTEWGFEQLISLEALLDTCNGYLVDDSCVFGAEVFVIGHSTKSETFSMAFDKPPIYGSFTWKLDDFSSFDNNTSYLVSKPFTIGERDWKLVVYPKGDYGDGVRCNYLSLFLELIDCERFPSNTTVNASFDLKILDKHHNKYYDKSVSNCRFCASNKKWGYSKFISLSELNEATSGYIKDDALIMKVENFKMNVIVEAELNEPKLNEAEKECIKDDTIITKEPPIYNSFTWKLEKFSKTNPPSGLVSKSFTVGDRDWTLMIYTKGLDSNLVNHLTLMLQLSNWNKFPSNTRVDASFKIKILDQLRNKYYEKTENFMFSVSKTSWSSSNFISLIQLHRAVNGYIKDDTLIIEVEILKMSPISPT